ncbi:hypothetical protein Tco_1051581 [Tanacetum coccineum]
MMQTERGDVVVGFKRRRRDFSSDGVEDLKMASGRNRLKSDLDDSTRVVQELSELQTILTYIDSRLESISRFLSGFTQQPNGIDVDDLEPDEESVDTPLVF